MTDRGGADRPNHRYLRNGRQSSSNERRRSKCSRQKAIPTPAEAFLQFSFPGGIPSHAAPGTPGSIHEGGELGYALAHAFGAAFDNPDLLVACVIGDGEAETGALSASWQSLYLLICVAATQEERHRLFASGADAPRA